jgi:hypothetical protein
MLDFDMVTYFSIATHYTLEAIHIPNTYFLIYCVYTLFDKIRGGHLGFWRGDLLSNSDLHLEGNPHPKFEPSRLHIFWVITHVSIDQMCCGHLGFWCRDLLFDSDVLHPGVTHIHCVPNWTFSHAYFFSYRAHIVEVDCDADPVQDHNALRPTWGWGHLILQ